MKSRFFTPFQIIETIAAITLVRTFLENFSNPEPVSAFTSFPLLINYFLFYTVVVLSIGIALGIITKQPWIKMISRVSYFLPVIWVAPLVDLMVSGGACLAYAGATGMSLVKDYIYFFGPFVKCGATIGLRVEVLLILASTGSYIWKKTKNFWHAILGIITIYSIIFFHGAIPGIIETIAGSQIPATVFFQHLFSISLLGTIHTLSNGSGSIRFLEQLAFLMGRIPWIMIVSMIPIIAWNDNQQKFKIWLGNIRITRVIYYSLIMTAGSLTALRVFTIQVPHTFIDILSYGIAFICIALSCWLAIVINDISDQEIDAVNSPDRPLISKGLTLEDMHSIGWITATLILTGSLLINWNFFILLSVGQIVYVIYSQYPLRMKRHYVFSSFLVGIAGLSVALAGYFLISPDQSFAHLPLWITFSIWLTFAIMSNTKDFKDVPGDTIANIQTLPVVFGAKKASKIISYVFIGWILIASLSFHNPYLAILSLPWIIIDLIIKKRIPEYIRFLIVFIEIIALFFIFK
jgi:4-hydroxybenzoate polyprenyltransferase